MITTQIQICSFCTKPLESPDHPCPQILYSLTNMIAKSKKGFPCSLGHINNLVFQGGGIKGLAYLGALRQLQSEIQKEREEERRSQGKETEDQKEEDFMSGIHRIAGTSAGSMVALYLGLGLDLDQIQSFLQRNFVELLDDSLTLNVTIEFNLVQSNVEKKYKAKKVFLKAMEYFKELEKKLNSSDKKVAAQAEKEVGDIARNITKYVGSRKFGVWAVTTIDKLGYLKGIIGPATDWLLTMLRPPKDTRKKLLKSNLETDSNSDCHSRFEEILKRECEIVLIEATQEYEAQKNNKKLLKSVPPTEMPPTDMSPTEKESPSMERDALKYLEDNNQDDELDQDVELDEDVEEDKDIEQDQNIEQQQVFKLKGPLQQSYALTGQVLHHAIGEIIYFVLLSKENAAGIQQQLGLFNGSIVKKELIEEPIRKAVGNLHKEPENITFKELWDLNSTAGNKFKKFYVTSFNMETFRTEVFSVEHTPNVVIADAVRASMSIPVFFTPVTIRERTAQGLTERKIYSSDSASAPIHYMDGGVLDNYPIWIFDDFKYCVQDIPAFKPLMRYAMQNPHTLGFRLMSSRIIDIYTNPYYDPERLKMKQINENKYEQTFSYQLGLLINAEINQTQENEHIKRGDTARTAYVDNLGMSAIQFELSPTDIENMIKAGKESVENYKMRATLNGFVGEGEAYF